MTREFYLDDVLLTSAVDLKPDAKGIAGLTSIADYGELGTGGVVIHDLPANRDVKGWHRFHAVDTDATPERLWTGYIYGQRITRLDPSDGSRTWDCDLNDLQAALTFRVFKDTDSSAQRPAETDLARLTWLLGTAQVAGLFEATALTNTTDNPVTLPAADFRHRFPGDVLRDMAGRSGKQMFLDYDEGADVVALFYDLATAATFQSTLRISNLPADENGVTIAPMDEPEAQLFRDPSDQYSGLDLQFAGGAVYLEDDDTATELGLRRDEVISSDAIGKRATAETMAAIYLAQKAVQKHTVTLSLTLTSAQVNLILAGSAIQTKLTHLPGYSSFIWQRVTRRVLEIAGPGHYVLHLELSLKVKSPPGLGGDPGKFPRLPCDAEPVQFKYDVAAVGFASVTLDDPPTPGNTLVIMGMCHDATLDTPAGFTAIEGLVRYPDVFDTDNGQMWYRLVQVGDGSTYANAGSGAGDDHNHIAVIELPGAGGLLDSDSVDLGAGPSPDVPFSVGSVTVSQRAILVSLGGYGDGNWSVGEEFDPVDSAELFDTSASVPIWSAGWRLVDAGTHNETYMYTGAGAEDGVAGIVAAFAFECPCPIPGQWTAWQFVAEGDGVTSQFTLPCPYQPGGLEVRVDSHPVAAGLTETTPEDGVFDLDFAPRAAEGDSPAEQLWARWLGPS